MKIIFYVGILLAFAQTSYSGGIEALETHSIEMEGDTVENPAFIAEVFQARRARVVSKMKGEIAVFSTSDPNNFYYGTGFDQSPAIAVLSPGSKHPFTLFIRYANPTAVLWDGPRYTIEEAVNTFGADTAYTLNEFERVFSDLAREAESVSLLYEDEMVNELILDNVLSLSEIPVHTDLSDIFNEMRVIKDPWEQETLARAVEVTCDAHLRALQSIRPGMYEYEIKAEIEYIFQKNGCTTGFNSIVGSGPNATYLHYPMYHRKLREGDLILIDVGAKCNHYTGDVTRTYPVSGKFSVEQKELYELVLKAQKASLGIMVPGVGTLEPHHLATEIIVEGLYDLGLITDLNSWWQKRFYVHYAGLHYIGLHVHDVGYFADIVRAERDHYVLNSELKGRPMEPGMVLTIEPGIYLVENRLDYLEELFGHMVDKGELKRFERKIRPVYEKYSGIGIRIEDDVLITETGHLNLSDSAPKTVEEIEKMMSGE